jgi:hypothetical protein
MSGTGKHLFVLDEPPRLLEGVWRAVGVIQADEIDLAAIDPAQLVDHPEIGRLGATDHSIGGGRAAVGHGLADLDFSLRDPGRIRAQDRSRSQSEIDRCGSKEDTARDHALILGGLSFRGKVSPKLRPGERVG